MTRDNADLGLHVTHMKHIQPWLSTKDPKSCLPESPWITFGFNADSCDSKKKKRKKRKALLLGSVHSSSHTMKLKHCQQAWEENLAYFFPQLIQVLSVLI